jgi:predicted ferric reductase
MSAAVAPEDGARRAWAPYHREAGSALGPWRAGWLQLRWRAAWPLQRSVHVRGAGHVSLGEALLLSGLTAGCAVNMNAAWYDPAAAVPNSPRESGFLPNILLALVLTTAARNSLLELLFGIPVERAVRWHSVLAVLMTLAGLYHGWMAVRFFSGWYFDSSVFLTGCVLLAAVCALVLSSLLPVRRRLFNLWLASHIAFASVTVVTGLLHCGGVFLVGLALLAIDVGIRYLVRAGPGPRKARLARCGGDTVRIEVARPPEWSYLAGQYCFVCLPALGLWQWHPLSICSAPACDQQHIVFFARALGDWSRSLYQLAPAQEDAAVEVDVLLDGPYGAPSVDVSGPRHKRFLLVGGGIGVTPMLSICNELLFEHDVMGRPLAHVRFVWAVRDTALVRAIGCPCARSARDPGAPRGAADPLRAQVFVSTAAAQKTDRQVAPLPFLPPSPHEQQEQEQRQERRQQSGLLEAGFESVEWRQGRPDLRAILLEIKDEALAAGDTAPIAVLVCGPASLSRDAICTALALSSSQLRFVVHSESFAL